MKVKLKEIKCPLCLAPVLISTDGCECEDGHQLGVSGWGPISQKHIEQAREYVENV